MGRSGGNCTPDGLHKEAHRTGLKIEPAHKLTDPITRPRLAST